MKWKRVVENIELPADGSEVRISHNLKVVPKYRIILRQSGEVFDGETEWTDKYIYLRAKGGSASAEDTPDAPSPV